MGLNLSSLILDNTMGARDSVKVGVQRFQTCLFQTSQYLGRVHFQFTLNLQETKQVTSALYRQRAARFLWK